MAFDQNKYITDYKRENYDAVTFLVPKGCKADIKADAAIRGWSMTEYIVRALEGQYGLDLTK